jgi:hypothetical protein
VARHNLILVGIGWLAIALACSIPQSNVDRRTTETQEPQESSAPKVELLSIRSERSSSSHIRLYGEIQNISAEPLNDLLVVATFRDGEGVLIKSQEFVIDQSSIAPGGRAPFMAITTFNGDMAKYEVSFRTTYGRVVGHIDNSRSPDKPKKKKK